MVLQMKIVYLVIIKQDILKKIIKNVYVIIILFLNLMKYVQMNVIIHVINVMDLSNIIAQVVQKQEY